MTRRSIIEILLLSGTTGVFALGAGPAPQGAEGAAGTGRCCCCCCCDGACECCGARECGCCGTGCTDRSGDGAAGTGGSAGMAGDPGTGRA